MAMSLVLTSFLADAKEIELAQTDTSADMTKTDPRSAARAGHLNFESSIGDLLTHPAFTGHSALPMPWSDRSYNRDMRLSDLVRCFLTTATSPPRR
jgi:hypothetical protein